MMFFRSKITFYFYLLIGTVLPGEHAYGPLITSTKLHGVYSKLYTCKCKVDCNSIPNPRIQILDIITAKSFRSVLRLAPDDIVYRTCALQYVTRKNHHMVENCIGISFEGSCRMDLFFEATWIEEKAFLFNAMRSKCTNDPHRLPVT